MAASFFDRLRNMLIGEDEALNALGGGSYRETVSGSVGRALLAKAWWAPLAAWLLDLIFGAGHCAAQAAWEAEREG